eukprot:7201944-Alexandrium_andersonii.AAC.1
MSASLVGSEMCIRDSAERARSVSGPDPACSMLPLLSVNSASGVVSARRVCLLYTSDAADDM